MREKYLKTANFASDQEKLQFLEKLYVYLMEEMHCALNQSVIQVDLIKAAVYFKNSGIKSTVE